MATRRRNPYRVTNTKHVNRRRRIVTNPNKPNPVMPSTPNNQVSPPNNQVMGQDTIDTSVPVGEPCPGGTWVCGQIWSWTCSGNMPSEPTDHGWVPGGGGPGYAGGRMTNPGGGCWNLHNNCCSNNPNPGDGTGGGSWTSTGLGRSR